MQSTLTSAPPAKQWSRQSAKTRWEPLDLARTADPCDPREWHAAPGTSGRVVTWERVQRFARENSPKTFLQTVLFSIGAVLAISVGIAMICGVVDIMFGASAVQIKTRREAWKIQHNTCQQNPGLHSILGNTCNEARAEVESFIDIEDPMSAFVAHMKEHVCGLIPGYRLLDSYHPLFGIAWLCAMCCGSVWLNRILRHTEASADFENRVHENERAMARRSRRIRKDSTAFVSEATDDDDNGTGLRHRVAHHDEQPMDDATLDRLCRSDDGEPRTRPRDALVLFEP